ncbi:MAG: nicotinate phosphoribosyltransferase [Planctomycetes bacterium]|nr:nicotinate phosphoribosyltransferase [Planctomycetota bacterium]
MDKTKSLFLTEDLLGLVTDLYQLSMAAGYFEQGMRDTATFELSVRHLPENRSYLVAAGLEQALHYLTHITFSQEVIRFLQQLPAFKHVSRAFFETLKGFAFSGDVYAVPEGTVVFAGEPLLRITAPLIEAQIAETYLLSTINFQTSIATKASRITQAARGREVVDFGSRRAHGPQAGVLAARAAFIGGCKGTSNVFASYQLGIPAVGTIAHAWVMAYESERDSFQKFHEVFPDNTVLLIDTYDTLAGARRAAAIGEGLKGVRLDSGNLLKLSGEVRRILDAEGLQHVKIVASGDLNEYRIDELVRSGAAIDSFGVGTEMVTSRDAPALGGVYKLVEQEHGGQAIPRMKFSTDKVTYPCKKQVYRKRDGSGNFLEDVIGLEGESIDGMSLLTQVMKDGKVCYPLPAIYEIQGVAADNLARLPKPFKRLNNAEVYSVTKSNGLGKKRQEAEKIIALQNKE